MPQHKVTVKAVAYGLIELFIRARSVLILIGGVLLGIVGVLVAIPVAAAIRLLLQEVAFPRLDKS